MESVNEMSNSELSRYKNFLGIQIFFLIISPFAGGFNYKIWSMLDSAILVSCIGFTGLAFALETKRSRDFVFKVGVILYILAVLDMSFNIIFSGWVGFKSLVN